MNVVERTFRYPTAAAVPNIARATYNCPMPLLARVETQQVHIGSFIHAPNDDQSSVEWWHRPCIAFTVVGSWRVRSRSGEGIVSPNSVLVAEGEAEYACHHPDGIDDRMLCILYGSANEMGPTLLVVQTPILRSLRRTLTRELRDPEPHQSDVDDLCLAILASSRAASGDGQLRPSRLDERLQRLKSLSDDRFADPSFDLIAEAAELGFTRTRFVHAFHQAVGVTPHRYLLDLRINHAARLLTSTGTPVIEVCFQSGFGSVTRFNAAFRSAFASSPTTYRRTHAAA